MKLKNPVMTASGCAGYGFELCRFFDLSELGALVVKTITRTPRAGNPMPRICETASGIINSIGLQNDGIEAFIEDKLPRLRGFGCPIIANVAGETADDFVYLVRRVSAAGGCVAIELNISCPNVSHGLDYAQDPKLTENLVSACRKATELPLIAKLSPNVGDIRPIAEAAERGGADIISAINTYLATAYDAELRAPKIAAGAGGLSGPAIKPLALRLVRQICETVGIPVIGIGGITGLADMLEFFCVGAKAVQIGTASFANPRACPDAVEELLAYMTQNGIENMGGVYGS
jgi:dihydroorotate dehydrogenase (NAD+) catalytic subunit